MTTEPRSYSQLGQDVWVYNALGHKRGGYFVELGAGDGIELSNTFALETHFGWTGVCIECSRQFQALCRNRRCICDDSCVSDKDGEVVTFLEDDKYGQHNHFSGIKAKINCHEPRGREYRLETRTLATVLRRRGAPRVMDYLSLDTEGSELAILSVLPHHEFRFNCITVEHNFQERERSRILDVLQGNGYVRVEQREWDDMYLHREWLGK
uniref:Methyltransferase FkbM domain-containing protein n=1 Tax=Chloropicon primus TaxID=1764295 RepID=A0A7S2T185_9CHLO|mmetsp:Transcript_3193/g.8853  ORF Transcript_3193/g.8853 Transcript_3193/m.8853 type:complete len:210 (+) Transcript_3193:248-877(+)